LAKLRPSSKRQVTIAQPFSFEAREEEKKKVAAAKKEEKNKTEAGKKERKISKIADLKN
jgi:hypothetical protein